MIGRGGDDCTRGGACRPGDVISPECCSAYRRERVERTLYAGDTPISRVCGPTPRLRPSSARPISLTSRCSPKRSVACATRTLSSRAASTVQGLCRASAPTNQFWMERGALNHRTSRVIDPLDGKIPAMTAAGQARASALAAARKAKPAESYESLTAYDRCISRSVQPRRYPERARRRRGMPRGRPVHRFRTRCQ